MTKDGLADVGPGDPGALHRRDHHGSSKVAGRSARQRPAETADGGADTGCDDDMSGHGSL